MLNVIYVNVLFMKEHHLQYTLFSMLKMIRSIPKITVLTLLSITMSNCIVTSLPNV